MKHLFSIFLVLLCCQAFAQTDPCTICPQLDTAALKEEQYTDYLSNCYKRDSIITSDTSYQITNHHHCKNYRFVSHYTIQKQEIILGYVLDEKDTLYTYTDKLPVFNERNKFLINKLKYPRDAERQGIEGKVHLWLFIDETGKIYKLKIKQSAHPLLDQEALRVMRLAPLMEPGQYKGVNKKFLLTMTISFKLPE